MADASLKFNTKVLISLAVTGLYISEPFADRCGMLLIAWMGVQRRMCQRVNLNSLVAGAWDPSFAPPLTATLNMPYRFTSKPGFLTDSALSNISVTLAHLDFDSLSKMS